MWAGATVDPVGAYELYREGREQLGAGEWLRAIPLLEAARDLEPAKGSIREALAVAYLRARRHADAAREAACAVECAPNDHYAYFLRGRALEGLGDTAEARGNYRLAAWLRPEEQAYQSALRRVEAAV